MFALLDTVFALFGNKTLTKNYRIFGYRRSRRGTLPD